MHPSSLSPWFHYAIEVFPHDTDYAGMVWHGSYVRWMEEVRVVLLRQAGVNYRELVELGCDLPVVDLSIRYRRALRMGDRAILKARLLRQRGVRLPWEYELWSADHQTLHLTATVMLVAVNMETGKVWRRLPPLLSKAMEQMQLLQANSDAEQINSHAEQAKSHD